MRYDRIHITGAAGSGTTTLGKVLASRLGRTFFDADDYLWLPTEPPYEKLRSPEERLAMILEHWNREPRAVLSGSVCGWGVELQQSFDLVVFLLIPTEVRLHRLRTRESLRSGRINEGFLHWASLYDEGDLTIRSRALHEQWLAGLNCKVLRIEGDLSVEDRMQALLAEA